MLPAMDILQSSPAPPRRLRGGGVFALVACVWVDLFPFTLLSDVTWAEFISITFLASSAAFVYHSRYTMRVGTDGPPPEVED